MAPQTPPVKEALPRWDLSEYYTGIDDPNIDKDLADDLAFAIQFEQKYKGKIASLSADELADAIAEYESNSQRPRSPGVYVNRMRSLHQSDPAVGKLMSKVQSKGAEKGSHMLFWSLELKQLDPQTVEQMCQSSPALAHYQPYLKDILKDIPHTLHEAAEAALQKRSPVSATGLMNRLYDETQDKLRFPFPDNLLEADDLARISAREGDAKQDGISMLTSTEISDYISSNNPAAREAAYRSRAKVCAENTYHPTFTMNAIIQSERIDNTDRGFGNSAEPMHHYNDVETDVVDTLVDTVKANYPNLSHRFLNLKAQMFGADKLKPWDVFAPLPDESETKISWQEAKDIILESFREFSPKMADIAQKFFDEGWIDAEPREGKMGGAYSAPNRASSHPFILTNFQGKLRDVTTLAHELGHGVHQYLAAEKQGDLMDGTSLTFAETASTFAEAVVFKKLLSRISDPKERKALLAEKVSDNLSTTTRQISFHDFETRIHAEQAENGELSAERFGEIWKEATGERDGDTIEDVGIDEGPMWGRISHFFHVPFYVYSYAFGDLLATSLYQKFEEMKAQGKGDEFEDKYIELLSAASTEHHSEILPRLFGKDFDLTQASFWQRGLDVYGGLMDDLEQAIADEKAAGAPSPSGISNAQAQGASAPDPKDKGQQV